jgi:sporulation protein YqfC
MSSFNNVLKEMFDLPAEVILDLPLIIMVGQGEFYLENHKGIALYQSDLIKIRVKSALLAIKGTNLKIENIKSDTLQITGNIVDLSYES